MADEQKPIKHAEREEVQPTPKKKEELSEKELEKLSGGPIYMNYNNEV